MNISEKITEHYFNEDTTVIASHKQHCIAEELCIDPVKFHIAITAFVDSISALFEDGDEPLCGDETRAIAECVLNALDYVNGR